jgi:hypothetical protein
MEIISVTKPKARKEHICNWCSCKIEKGSIYTNSFCVHDGETYTWKNHIHCEEIANKLKMFNYDDGYGVTDEAFQEAVREEYILLMQHYHFELYESEFFQYPNFEGKLAYVCEMHNILKP